MRKLGITILYFGTLTTIISVLGVAGSCMNYIEIEGSSSYYRTYKGLTDWEIEQTEHNAALVVEFWCQAVWGGIVLAALGAILESLAERTLDHPPPPPPCHLGNVRPD